MARDGLLRPDRPVLAARRLRRPRPARRPVRPHRAEDAAWSSRSRDRALPRPWGCRPATWSRSFYIGTDREDQPDGSRRGRPQHANRFLVVAPGAGNRSSWERPSATPPALTLFPSLDHEWIVWTPHGYYETSPLGDRKYLGWHRNRLSATRPDRLLHIRSLREGATAARGAAATPGDGRPGRPQTLPSSARRKPGPGRGRRADRGREPARRTSQVVAAGASRVRSAGRARREPAGPHPRHRRGPRRGPRPDPLAAVSWSTAARLPRSSSSPPCRPVDRECTLNINPGRTHGDRGRRQRPGPGTDRELRRDRGRASPPAPGRRGRGRAAAACRARDRGGPVHQPGPGRCPRIPFAVEDARDVAAFLGPARGSPRFQRRGPDARSAPTPRLERYPRRPPRCSTGTATGENSARATRSSW